MSLLCPFFPPAEEISSLASSGGTTEIPAESCGIFDVTNSPIPQFPTGMATQAQSQSSSHEMQPIMATRNNLAKKIMCRPCPERLSASKSVDRQGLEKWLQNSALWQFRSGGPTAVRLENSSKCARAPQKLLDWTFNWLKKPTPSILAMTQISQNVRDHELVRQEDGRLPAEPFPMPQRLRSRHSSPLLPLRLLDVGGNEQEIIRLSGRKSLRRSDKTIHYFALSTVRARQSIWSLLGRTPRIWAWSKNANGKCFQIYVLVASLMAFCLNGTSSSNARRC